MARTITINRGNQYNADGFVVTSGPLRAWGEPDASKADGYNLGGSPGPWCDPEHKPAISQAIWATLTDGKERIVEIGRVAAPTTEPEPTSHVCPRCGTYCMGDCEAN